MFRFKGFDSGEKGTAGVAVRGRFRAGFAAGAAVLAVIVVLAVCLAHANGEKQKLETALTQAEQKLELREDAQAALEAQKKEQDSLIRELQGKLEDLLNVQEQEPVITRDQVEEQLSSLRELVTHRYIYTNAARREDSKTWLMDWTLPFSESSLLVTYDGEIKAGIDFGAIRVDVDENRREVTVTLPASRVTDNTIPQESINVLTAKNGLFNKISFEDYNQFIAAEKPAMEERAVERGLLSEADREAREAVRALLELIPGMDTYKLTVKSEPAA